MEDHKMASLPKRENNEYSGAELTRLYKRYRSQYNDKAHHMAKKGMTMWDKIMSKTEFQAYYAAAANDLTKKYASEKAKSERVIDYIVDKQATEISHEQAKAYQKAQKDKGIDISLRKIYTDLPTMLREENERLLKEGVTNSSERKAIIATVFFGSP